MNVPTIDELLEKFEGLLSDAEFAKESQSCESFFRMVASGQLQPRLTDQNAIMAAQCVSVIFEHAKLRLAGNEPMPGCMQFLKSEIVKQHIKQDNEDFSLDWNLGFNAACKYFLDTINIAYPKPKPANADSHTAGEKQE
jgi:hypothetical protein